MEDNYQSIKDNLDKYYENLAVSTCRDLEVMIKSALDSCGLIYRLFTRKKSKASIAAKMMKKAEEKYIPQNKKMQDLVGIRIVLYFNDDIDVCIEIMRNLFGLEVGREHDRLDTETFKPQRVNYIFKIPEAIICVPELAGDLCYIDNTFEVQIRTIFSEGWHEVEHDIRYKFIEDWEREPHLARELNGLLAVLELCDHDIVAICDKLAYRKYKSGEWESMIRNHFRIRLDSTPLLEELSSTLTSNKEIGKIIYRFEREELIKLFEKTKLPKNYNNVVYLINEHLIKNTEIASITPNIIRSRYKKLFL